MQTNDGPRTPPLPTGTTSVFEGLNVLFSPFISMAMKTVQAPSKPTLTYEQATSMRTANTLDPDKFCIAELSHANSELPLLPREAAASANALEDEEQPMNFHRLRTPVPLTHAVEEDGTQFVMTPTSNLRSGKITSHATGVEVINAPASAASQSDTVVETPSPSSSILEFTKEETKKAPRCALRAMPPEPCHNSPAHSFCSELAVNRYAQAYLHDDFAHLFVGKETPLWYDNVNRYAEGIVGLETYY
jgi:hypothetical protein